MPDLRPLNDLRQRLAQALAPSHADRSHGWAPKPTPISAELAATVAAFGRDSEAPPSSQAMVDAVRDFVQHRKVQNFTHLKHVCFGVTIPYDAKARLIDHKLLFPRLIELVDERQDQAKPFRRCYQGLLSGYFAFERRESSAKTSADAGRNWLALRGFLGERLAAVQRSTQRLTEPPLWLSTLLAHRNLLQDKPCQRYAADLRRGDLTELKRVFSALEIQGSSWVWHEAVLAYMLELVEDTDRPFKADLRTALDMVRAEDRDRKLPGEVAKTATALLAMRYAKCQDRPEHDTLRDVCIERIGHPWLNREAWDGAVRDEEARRMVESWLKRGLIRDFFQLLSHEGAADARRLDYWLAWEPHISDMWFALGGATRREPQDTKLKELRARMRGRERALTGSTSGNTAFIMRIGQLQVVEFGEKGNACYVREAAHYAGDLDEERQSIHALKQPLHSESLRHDGPWESDFDSYLRKRLGIVPTRTKVTSGGRLGVPKNPRMPMARPTERPIAASSERQTADSAVKAVWPEYKRAEAGSSDRNNSTATQRKNRSSRRPVDQIGWEEEIRHLAAWEGLKITDRRSLGGAFWLLARDAGEVSAQSRERLKALGFRWAPDNGFYRDDD